MSYNIKLVNPIVGGDNTNFDVVVSYDNDKDRFCVHFISGNSGYFIARGDLVENRFKYTSQIIDEILAGCETDEELSVLFTERASNEINLIWMANCELF